MSRRPAWTDRENAALARLYCDMLGLATAGHAYNKAGMVRSYQGTDDAPEALHARSRGSIEAKLMNATACHAKLQPEAVTMDGHGYRALVNYQAALLTAMRTELPAHAAREARRA